MHNELTVLRNRVAELEAEVVAHRRAALMLFLEFATRRPQEKVHLINLLTEVSAQMGPQAADVAQELIRELKKL